VSPRVVKCTDTVGAVIPVEGSKNLLVSLGLGLYILNRDTGQ